MGILILMAGVEFLLFGTLEYFLLTRRKWWRLTGLLPFLGLVLYRNWRETEWLALSIESRAKFGVTRWLEQGFFAVWLAGLVIGAAIAICRGPKKRTKQDEEKP